MYNVDIGHVPVVFCTASKIVLCRSHGTAMQGLFLKGQPENNVGLLQKAVQLLAKHGANVNTDVFMGKTPIALAAEWCNLPLVQDLLGASANPTIEDNAGRDALAHAKQKNCSAVISVLSRGQD